MILKYRPEDFRVMENLKDGILGEGPYIIYRVVKMKLTTLEAIDQIAKAAQVERKEIGFAGLKDRQGITVQYVSIPQAKPFKIESTELLVKYMGKSAAPISSESVTGNLFEIVARDVTHYELDALEQNLYEVRRFGLPNYFDDQRFGCVRHGQGFIFRELMQDNLEKALQALLVASSPFDSVEQMRKKNQLRRHWGDWEKCVTFTQRQQHSSLFQHLMKNPKDFVGAFRFIPARIRLIHLYAYQSYLWNKSVSLYLHDKLRNFPQVNVPSDIGLLFCHRKFDSFMQKHLQTATFPLLDAKTVVRDPEQHRASEAVLKKEGTTQKQLAIKRISGFILKGEERKLLLYPAFVRMKTPRADQFHRGRKQVELRFQLPPGAYATLVMKRFFAADQNAASKDFKRRDKKWQPKSMNRP